MSKVSKRVDDEGFSSDEYSEDFEEFDFEDMMPKRRNKVSKSKTATNACAAAATSTQTILEPTVPVKYVLNGSLRRANLARPLDITVLLQRLRESFGDSETERQFQLAYQDDEGDTITIATTEELAAAADCAQSAGRVLLLNVTEATSNVNNEASNKNKTSEPAAASSTDATSTTTTQAPREESSASAKGVASAAAGLAAQKIQRAAERKAARVEQAKARNAERVKQAQLRRERRAAIVAEREARRRALQANRERSAAAASTPLIPTSTARLEFEPMALVEIRQPTCLMYGRVVNFNASLGKYLVMVLGDDCGTSSRQLASQSAQHFAPHELTRLGSQPGVAHNNNVHQQPQPDELRPAARATLFDRNPKPKVYRHPFLHKNSHQIPGTFRRSQRNSRGRCVRGVLAVIAMYFTLSCFFSGTMSVLGVIGLGVFIARRTKMLRRGQNFQSCAQRWRQKWLHRFEYIAAIDTSDAMEALPFIQMALLAIGFLSGTTLFSSVAWATSIVAMAIKLLRVSYAMRTGDEGAGIAPWAACIRDKFTATSRTVGNGFLAFVRGPKNGVRDRRESFAVFLACLAGLLFVYLSLKFVTPIFWVTHFLGTRNGFGAHGSLQQQQQQQQQPISSSGPCTAEQNEQLMVSSILAAIERAPPALRASFSNQLFQALGKPNRGRVGRTRFNALLRNLQANGVTVTGLPLC